jgi:microsomal dipeptidase-like Zn-dependent dipeptidase
MITNFTLAFHCSCCYRTPQGLEDVSTYPTLFAALIGTGQWSTEDLKKLAGLNFLRVMQDVEKVMYLKLMLLYF